MSALEIVMIVALLVMGVFLVITMLMQKNEKGLSGTVAGGSETYYGSQGKKERRNRIINILTIVVAIVFVLVVLAAFVFQPDFGVYSRVDVWQDASEGFSDFYKNFPTTNG